MPYWFDGNNVIGQSTARASADRETRRQFLSYLSGRFRSKGGRFLVFFDGDDPDRSTPPPGVKVRFSAPLSTDDAILREIAGARNRADIIVVTNDRGLSSRTKDLGAKSVTWAEFDSKQKPAADKRGSSRDTPVDVGEWLRYFGVDDETG